MISCCCWCCRCCFCLLLAIPVLALPGLFMYCCYGATASGGFCCHLCYPCWWWWCTEIAAEPHPYNIPTQVAFFRTSLPPTNNSTTTARKIRARLYNIALHYTTYSKGTAYNTLNPSLVTMYSIFTFLTLNILLIMYT